MNGAPWGEPMMGALFIALGASAGVGFCLGVLVGFVLL